MESVAVYVTIVEFGEILRNGSSGSNVSFDEEAVVVSMPTTPDGSGSDLPPSYEEAMAAKQQQQQQEEQQQQQSERQAVTAEDAATLNALPYTR